MFIPPSFRVDDQDLLYSFVERYGFATLVTVRGGEMFASHVPLLLDRAAGLLLGHLARGNPQWEAFDGTEALAVFVGPHGYVSPSWYVTEPAVPTWNFTAVHVYGIPRLLSPDRAAEVVDRTVLKFEAGRPSQWPNRLPEEFRQRMLAGIVGFEMPIARIEGKFKLSQNRSASDQAGVIEGLRSDGVEPSLLAAFMSQFYLTGPDTKSNTAPDGRA